MRQPTPILGTYLDGDLAEFAVPFGIGPTGQRRLFGLPFGALTQHLVVLGASGTGKSVSLIRLVSSVAQAARVEETDLRILFLDAKGSSQEVAIAFRAAMEKVGRTVHFWPSQGIDGFSGTRSQLVQRISSLFDRGESAFHQAEIVAMLDLSIGAGEPPRALAELLSRCRPGATAALYEAEGTEPALARLSEAKSFSASQWNALSLRLRALSSSVHDRFDQAQHHPRLADLRTSWISIPGTDGAAASADIAALLLALVAELAAANDPTPTLMILDEASAITASKTDARASEACAALAERTRSAGVALVFGAQSLIALGDHGSRLIANAGTVLTHRTPVVPEEIVSLAGTRERWEDLHAVDPSGMRLATGGRRQQIFGLDPNRIRQLPPGVALVAREGRWAEIAIAPVP